MKLHKKLVICKICYALYRAFSSRQMKCTASSECRALPSNLVPFTAWALVNIEQCGFAIVKRDSPNLCETERHQEEWEESQQMIPLCAMKSMCLECGGMDSHRVPCEMGKAFR